MNQPLKLHIGCGPVKMPGYINIDKLEVKPGVVDRIFDLTQPLDYPDGSVDEILGYHVFEHLPFSSIEAIVNSWYRVLTPGGLLIMEMPDLDGTVKWYLEMPNDNARVASIYGSQEHEGQYHHWGWNKTRLKFLLEGVGFSKVEFPEPIDYHKDLEPCLRVVATK